MEYKDQHTELLNGELNKIYNQTNEYICEVDIAASDSTFDNLDKRILIYSHNSLPLVTDTDIARIWKNKNSLKVFISHRDTHKREAEYIQNELIKFNISSFVAHKDITPTEEWIKEILLALNSMDLFLTYMTENFFESVWTNQEIGFALGKNTPIIPIKNNKTPLGFISILQATPYKSDNFCLSLISLILGKQNINEKIKSKLIDCIIYSLENSKSWSETIYISKTFDNIESISDIQKNKIIHAFNNNKQISECTYISGYNYAGKKIGDGIICKKLNLWTGKKHEIKQYENKVTIVELQDRPADIGEIIDNIPF